LLLTSLLLQRAWVSDRLFSGRALTGLAFAGLLVVGSVGGGLEYRMAEVPEGGQPFDLAEFLASLPAPEQNEAGNQIRQAVRELQEWEQEVTLALRPPEPPAAGGGAPGDMGGMGGGPMAGAAGPGGPVPPAGLPMMGGPLPPGGEQAGLAPPTCEEIVERRLRGRWGRRQPCEELVERVLRDGWGGDEAELARWLDHLFLGPWVARLCQGAAAPPGVVEDPRRLTLFTNLPDLRKCTWPGQLFAARALQ